MRSTPFSLRTSCALAALSAPSLAQEVELQRIPVVVTAVDGARAYLDRGSDERIAIGDRVELYPDGRPKIEAIVRGVTRASARIEWTSAEEVSVGTPGEVLVPANRRASGAAAHPPWAQGAEGFDQSLPLLAPVKGISDWERERRLHGRWFAGGDWTAANVNGEQDYLLARTGLELALDNPFGQGGALEFDGEVYHRAQSLWDEGDEGDSIGRIDRLSTWWGGVRGRERRYEIGRFLQHEFPEFGVIDGAEVTFRTPGGDRYGASAGFLPAIDDVRSTGEDTAVSAYYRHVVGEDEHASLGAGFQKTWHEGSPDRDLAVVNGHWRADSRWSVYGSAWIDLYGSEDQTKGSGAELTQVFANVTRRFDSDLTLGLYASQYRWPELARDELPPLTAKTLADGEVTRAGASASKSLSKRWRVWARGGGWSDQDDGGGNAELTTGVRDLLFERSDTGASLFLTQGKYSDLQGARLWLSGNFDAGYWRLDYELAQAEQHEFTGEQSSLLQHAVRASLDFLLGASWSLSLRGDTRFGDEQESVSAGFFLQRQF